MRAHSSSPTNHGRRSRLVALGRDDDDVIEDDSELQRGFVASEIFLKRDL